MQSQRREREIKAPTVLFLGAGASASIGFPTTKQVMERMGLEPYNLEQQKHVTNYPDLLYKIYTKLPKEQKDLEGILEYLRKANNPLSSCHNDIIKERIKQSIPQFEDPAKREEVSNTITKTLENDKEETKKLEEEVKKFMFDIYIYEPEKHTESMEKIYRPLIELLLLEPIFGEDLNELSIFTTNYDMVIERLIEKPFMKNFELVDGFKAGKREGEFSPDEYEKQYTKTVIKLFKLHGSLNWWIRKEDNKIVSWPDITTMNNPNYESIPAVIYPAGYGPYPRDEFHILHNYLEKYLTEAKRCIVVGYTFRDIGRAKHIFDDVIRDLNPNLRVIVSDIKLGIDDPDLGEVKDLFGKYEGRYEYYDGGIETLPEKLKEKYGSKKQIKPKEEKGEREPY